MNHKVAYGIPVYGAQTKTWWGPLVEGVAELYKHGIEYVPLPPYESMMVDFSRNHIVDSFLKSDAEWLKWIDADNIEKPGSLRRLLDTHKTLVTGVYVKRSAQKPEPVVYVINEFGLYNVLEKFTPGEIIPVDAAGMGACLVHRSVFEDIQRTHRMLDLATGGVRLFHKDDIIGDVFDDSQSPNDGKVIEGVHHVRLRIPTAEKVFCHFLLGDGRTEDYGFFESARRAGHQLWADTSVEVGHIGEFVHKPKDWRTWQRNQK